MFQLNIKMYQCKIYSGYSNICVEKHKPVYYYYWGFKHGVSRQRGTGLRDLTCERGSRNIKHSLLAPQPLSYSALGQVIFRQQENPQIKLLNCKNEAIPLALQMVMRNDRMYISAQSGW